MNNGEFRAIVVNKYFDFYDYESPIKSIVEDFRVESIHSDMKK